MYEKILHKIDIPDWPFPWKRPKTQYESDGPSSPIVASIGGVDFRIAPTGEDGMHTGRSRYLVICCDCQEVLHQSTTGPSVHIRRHISDAHQPIKETT